MCWSRKHLDPVTAVGSSRLGYVLGLARHSDQRVVLLYDAARVSAISRLIVGTHDGKCKTKAAYARQLEDSAVVSSTAHFSRGGRRYRRESRPAELDLRKRHATLLEIFSGLVGIRALAYGSVALERRGPGRSPSMRH